MATLDELQPLLGQASANKLFPFEDVENGRGLGSLASGDREALLKVANWIRTFVIQPNKQLGREGPVCPFVPVSIQHKALWLAAERSAGLNTPQLIQLIQSYQQRLLSAQPLDGEGGAHRSTVVVFTDLPAANAKAFFEGALQQIGLPSYADHGFVMGPFYEGNEGTAVYNANFRPFTSPVPMFLMRLAVISDWKFFLNNDDFFRVWKRRYGEAAVDALAEQLRQLPWNARRG